MSKDYVQNRNERWTEVLPKVNLEGILGRTLRITRHYQDQSRDLVATYNLKPSEFDVLCSLYLAGKPLTPTEITAFAYRTPGAITNVLDHLERKKLLERHQNEKSRRSILITLTPSGQNIIEELFPQHVAMENAMLNVLPEDEKEQLRSLLKKVLLHWENSGKINSPNMNR